MRRAKFPRKWLIAGFTFVATALAALLIANLSLSVNDEANLNVYDRDFAAAQARIFEADLKRSKRISLQEWQNRPWTEKLWKQTMGLFSSQL